MGHGARRDPSVPVLTASPPPATRWCPSCRRAQPSRSESCPDCLAALVDDLAATVACRHCGRVCPARMQSCPGCLGELDPDPAVAADAMAAMLARGGRVPRPEAVPAFATGADCTLLRAHAASPLVYAGPEGLLEAHVEGRDTRAVPPLRGVDLDGTLLFRLARYERVDDALVASGEDGAPIGTYLRWSGPSGPGLDVRDETSAPVARLRRCRRDDADYELVETGGGVLAVCTTSDIDLDGWVDDEWSIRVQAQLPLRRLAAVALVLAAKVLLGRPSPARRAEDLSEDDAED